MFPSFQSRPNLFFRVITLARGLGLFVCVAALLWAAPAGIRAEAPHPEQGPEVIRAVVPANFPPQYTLSGAGEPQGFGVDVFDQIARRAGFKVEYEVAESWAGALETLKIGVADVIPNLGVTEARKAYCDFTRPVETFSLSVFVRSSTDDIRTVADLAGRRVAAVEANYAVSLLFGRGDVDLVILSNPETALLELLSGNVDAMAYPRPPLLRMARSAGLADRIKAIEPPLAEVKRAVAIRKGMPGLASRLDRAVQEFVATEEFKELYAKWYGRPPAAWTWTRVLMVVVATVLLVALFMAAWRYVSLARLNRALTIALERQEQAEQGLAESEERFRLAFENASVGMAIVGLDGRLVRVNRKLCSMFGYSAEEFMDMTVNDTAHPDDLDKSPDFINKALAGEAESATFKKRHLTRDGRVLWTRISSSIVRSPGGGPLYFISQVQDITEEVEAGTEIRKRDEMLTLMSRMARMGAWEHDGDGGNGTWTEEVARIHEVDPKASAGVAFGLSFYVGDSRKRIEEAVARSITHGEPYDLELELKTAKGNLRWVRTVGRPVMKNGKVLRVQGTFQDITERKMAEMLLAESEERFRTVFQKDTIGKAITGIDGKILRANEAFAGLLGYSVEELAGRHFQDLTHPDDVAACREISETLLSGEREAEAIEKRHIKKDGTLVWTLVKRSLLRDSGGQPLYFIVSVQDLSELKAAGQRLAESRQALEHSEERFLKAFQGSTALMAITSVDDGRFVEVNDAYLESLGYRRDEVLGKSHVELGIMGPGDAAALEEAAQEETRYRDYPLDLTARNGTVLHVMAHTDRIRVNSHESLLWVLTDMTERKKLEEQFHQAQKMEAIGRLAGGVAHDFNNMLGIIIGYSDLTLDELDNGNPLKGNLEEIRKAASRSAELTTQLLAFARRQTASPRILDLNEAVEGMKKMIQRLIGEDVRLDFIPAPGLWKVKVDPVQVHQVLVNLAVNARDAIAGAGEIRVETANLALDEDYAHSDPETGAGDFVMLAVSDTGCGMDAATRNQAFEPFFTTKEKGEGTGLGLSTVFGIVKQNRGLINLYSEPGEGTTVKIYLPRIEGVRRERAGAATGEESLRGKETVLVVEDEVQILRLCKTVLEGYGYRALSAKSPGEAIVLAEEHPGPIDLLLTDVIMPGMNGKELEGYIRSMKPGIHTLFMSGYTADLIARKGVLAEGIHYIQKPFSPANLARKIREVLDQKPGE